MNVVKTSLPVLILCAVASLFLFSFSKADNVERVQAKNVAVRLQSDSASKLNKADKIYDSIGLAKAGLSKVAFDYAMKGYQTLLAQGKILNQKYLTIVDFTKSSRQKRFFLLDIQNYKLVLNTFVAHGKNTGVDMAEQFSNAPESNKSSLGFYVTKGTYIGKHGLSLRVAGMEEGFNDNAESRGIVVHAADYVNAARVNSGYMGRSQGCPALPNELCAEVINMIKDGSAMFLYYPAETYLKSSKMLNA
jgi:hypothetical protein